MTFKKGARGVEAPLTTLDEASLNESMRDLCCIRLKSIAMFYIE